MPPGIGLATGLSMDDLDHPVFVPDPSPVSCAFSLVAGLLISRPPDPQAPAFGAFVGFLVPYTLVFWGALALKHIPLVGDFLGVTW